jgi:MFS family permease
MTISQGPPAPAQPTMRRLIVGAIFGGLIVGLLYEAALELQPSIEAVSSDLGIPPQAVGVALAASLAAHLAATRWLVPLGDHFSRRTLSLVGTALAAVPLGLMAFSESLGGLTVAAAATGALVAATYLVQALLLSSAREEKKGLLSGIFTMMWALGIVGGKVLGVQFAEAGHWRLGPLVQAGALAVLAVPLWGVLPRESRPPTPAQALAHEDLERLGPPLERRAAGSVPKPRERRWRGPRASVRFHLHWASLQLSAVLRVGVAARYDRGDAAYGAKHLPVRELLRDRKLRALSLAAAAVAATLTPFDNFLATEVVRQGHSLTWLSVLSITFVLGAAVAALTGHSVDRNPRPAVLAAGLLPLAAWGVMVGAGVTLAPRPSWLAATFAAETLLEVGTTLATAAIPAIALMGRDEHTTRINAVVQQFRMIGGVFGALLAALGFALAGWAGVEGVALVLSVGALLGIRALLKELPVRGRHIAKRALDPAPAFRRRGWRRPRPARRRRFYTGTRVSAELGD